jgi:hypothetical protein
MLGCVLEVGVIVMGMTVCGREGALNGDSAGDTGGSIGPDDSSTGG